MIRGASPSDCLTVFSEPQLRHRGVADDDTARDARAVAADNEESLFAVVVEGELELEDVLAMEPDGVELVTEWLAHNRGRSIAFGKYPPYSSSDSRVALDGIVPAPTGEIIVGIY